MPLKAIRTKFKPKDVMLGVTSIAAVVANVADMASFPPVRAAATVLLVILQTIQEIESNKDACHRLARRAARLLLDLKHRMEGRWEDAPDALVKNILEFEKILNSIREFMEDVAKMKWMSRLLQKGSIEESLERFYEMIDEAEKSFQIASLVEIHYAVGQLQPQSNFGRKLITASSNEKVFEIESPPVYEVATMGSQSISSSASDNTAEETRISKCLETSHENIHSGSSGLISKSRSILAEENRILELELAQLDTYGFKRLHQSEVRLKTSMKSMGSESFWSGCSVADVGGQRSVVKRYENSDEEGGKEMAKKRWLYDIKRLKELFHANLPQMLAYSGDNTATPFVVLADVKLRDPNTYLLNFLLNRSIADCVAQMLRMYRDVSNAVLYTQKQLRLDENEAQNFVSEASYSLDNEGNVIVGLPPPKSSNSVTIYSYGLTDSLLRTTLKYLPSEDHFVSLRGMNDNDKIVELRNKYAHFRAIALNLLPKGSDPPALIQAIEDYLDEEKDGSSCLTPLARLRDLKLNAGGHDHTWHEGVHACAVQFDVGDVGYISGTSVDMLDKSRFNNFVKIGNVLERYHDRTSEVKSERSRVPFAAHIPVVRESSGMQTQWVNGLFNRQDVYPFILPGDVEGWPLSLAPQAEISILVHHTAKVDSVNEAWRFLINEANAMAKNASIEPQNILMITSSVRGRTYTVRRFGHSHHMHLHGMQSGMTMNHPHAHKGFGTGRPGTSASGLHQIPAFPLPVPHMLYLFTSSRTDFEAFWSSNPSAASTPPGKRDPMPRDITERTGWPEAYINYIQLSKEDFIDEHQS